MISAAYEIANKGTEYEIYPAYRRGWNDHAEGAAYGQRGSVFLYAKIRLACMGK